MPVKMRSATCDPQVLTTTGSTFRISYPPTANEIQGWASIVNLPVSFLPFGCVSTDYFFKSILFDLLLKTLLPLIVVALLMVAAHGVRAYYGPRSRSAELCTNAAFVLIS